MKHRAIHSTRHDEDGVALLSVIGITLLVLTLAGIAFTLSLEAQRQSVDYSNYHASLAAADAGLDDYLARLNRVPGYYTTFNEGNPGDNDALDGWADVPSSPGEYHVDVDASQVNATGTVTVRSTGRFNGEARTVETTFRPDGFLDFIYFTEYEILDPAAFGNPVAACNRYSYDGRSDAQCGIIRFVTGDTIQGPFHTNDAMVIDGDPTFTGEATTSYPGTDGVASPDECDGTPAGNRLFRASEFGYTSNPDFQQGLCFAAALPVPLDNQSIQDQTTNAGPSTQGCSYYGPTYIEFYDPSPAPNDGRMRVKSPWSANGAPGGAIPTAPYCGGADLGTAAGADIAIPPNGVIYVDDDTGESCTNNRSGHPLNLPRPLDDSFYDCDIGDVFVWGTVDGQVTIGAQNNINIVWDVVYSDDFPDTDDLLGLVSNNNVQIYHPWDESLPKADENLDVWGTYSGNNIAPFIPGRTPGTMMGATTNTFEDPMVHAAIMAVRHSFRVQNFRQGARFTGDLSIRGAIAQFYRGAVGTSGGGGGSGYIKDYVYDDRLKFLSPPYFVQPGGETTWKAKTWAELVPPDDLPA